MTDHGRNLTIEQASLQEDEAGRQWGPPGPVIEDGSCYQDVFSWSEDGGGDGGVEKQDVKNLRPAVIFMPITRGDPCVSRQSARLFTQRSQLVVSVAWAVHQKQKILAAKTRRSSQLTAQTTAEAQLNRVRPDW